MELVLFKILNCRANSQRVYYEMTCSLSQAQSVRQVLKHKKRAESNRSPHKISLWLQNSLRLSILVNSLFIFGFYNRFELKSRITVLKISITRFILDSAIHGSRPDLGCFHVSRTNFCSNHESGITPSQYYQNNSFYIKNIL